MITGSWRKWSDLAAFRHEPAIIDGASWDQAAGSSSPAAHSPA